MIIKKLLVIPFLIIVSTAFSQTDSIAVCHADWQIKRITRGVKLKTFCFNNSLFNSNQNISILEVKPGRKVNMDLGYEPKILKKTSQFGINDNAISAINGTFFDIKNGGSTNYIRSNGVEINKNKFVINNGRNHSQQSAIVFNNGRISILQWDNSSNWEENIKGEDIMVTGPVLITQGERSLIDSSSFSITRHPRSLIAIKGRKVLLITVDGRNESSAGMSLFELASLSKWLKTDDAVNLDGGGSTSLWVKDQPDNGIVNYPSDNKKWDHAGERKVANVILVKRRSD